MVEPREWLIRKDGYFYRPNCAGYTTSKFEAGRYTKAEAEREAAVEPWHMKAIHQDDVEDDPVSSRVRMDGETIASLKARISELERALAERPGGVRFVGNIPGSSSASGFVPLATEPAAPEGRQGVCATEGCDNHATNQFIRGGVGSTYCGDCFVKVIEACETTRPAEQAVTEAMVEAACEAFGLHERKHGLDHRQAGMREALKAAMEAGRHD